MNKLNIGFIGAGNMTRSLIGGLIASDFPASSIHTSAPDIEHLQVLADNFAIQTSANNQDIVEHCDVIVFAVKPQILKSVCQQLKPRPDGLYLSIAAGIPTTSIANWLGQSTSGEPLAIIRAMPNTPALLQSGATALFANAHTRESQRESAEAIMRAVGLALWVEEEAQMDAVTALSGSGPAYYFLFMEAMINAAQEMGLNEKTAHLLTVQTAFGASKMALEIDKQPATLRQNVTSPGGTTERAIQTFQQGGFEKLVNEALTSAQTRAHELAEELGK
ncbi:Pyrroline-5-carboxylate reductase [hydrothermal vent metagenome]|uniref:Pyrroline-5-carboxylate reductase n=1 Tax=hydrothermal vent metagenome TaxID=652676 RepID=A0A3B1AT80_9ZZZZ